MAPKQDKDAKGRAEENSSGKFANDELWAEENNVNRSEFAWVDHGR
jgi:hypothetical protein